MTETPSTSLPCTDGAAPLRPGVFSTTDLPAAQQFTRYRDECARFVHVTEALPGAFPILATSWPLGPFALGRTLHPAVGNLRSAAHIRRDQIDHWSISIIWRGRLQGRVGDTVLDAQPGVPHVFSLGEPNEMQREAGDWLRLFVARDAMPELAAALDAVRNRPLDTPLWRLVGDYLECLALRLPTMTGADQAGIVAATRAMITAAASSGGPARQDALHAAQQPIEAVQRARIIGLIRRNLGSALMGPERLCRLAGVSRSQLYRIFEPLGGVARTIQLERLRAARRCLADPEETRNIVAIAEGFGFFDASTFSRAFRLEFGMTPGALRRGQAPAPAVTPQAAAPAGDFLEVLRRLRG